MNQKKLNEILEKHALWLRSESGGVRANLREVDLRGANLYGANLRRANLREVDLCGANLYEANLYEVDLRRANLCGANLHRANLYGANLREVDLRGANLYGANLCGANLCGANLCGAENIPYIPMACPDTGEFIAWKKAYGEDDLPYLVKLLIPEDARRSSATGRKCRADKAVVLSIELIVTEAVAPEVVYSKYDKSFAYKVGQVVTVPNFDIDRFDECAPGIHFFINRQEAIDYLF